MSALILPSETLQTIFELCLYSYPRPQSRYERDRFTLDTYFWPHPSSARVLVVPEVDYAQGTSLALVCRNWRESAQEVTYRYIDIKKISEDVKWNQSGRLEGLALFKANKDSLESEEDRWAALKHSLCTSNTALASYVRHIRLSKYREMFRAIGNILDGVHNLEIKSDMLHTLYNKSVWLRLNTIHLIGEAIYNDTTDSVGLHSLYGVDLQTRKLCEASRLPMVCDLPSDLKCLELQWNALRYDIDAQGHNQGTTFEALTHLTLRRWWDAAGHIFPYILGPMPSFPSLTHLALDEFDGQQGQNVRALLKQVGSRLECLIIKDTMIRNGWREPSFRLDANLLRLVPNLKELQYSSVCQIPLSTEVEARALPRTLRRLRLGWMGGGDFDVAILDILKKSKDGLYHLSDLDGLPHLYRIAPRLPRGSTEADVIARHEHENAYCEQVHDRLPHIWRPSWQCPDLEATEWRESLWEECSTQEMFDALSLRAEA